MKKKLIIEGMSCRHCVSHVTEALEDIPGVESVTVDLENMSAEVELSRDISEEEFRFAIENAGYELTDLI